MGLLRLNNTSLINFDESLSIEILNKYFIKEELQIQTEDGQLFDRLDQIDESSYIDSIQFSSSVKFVVDRLKAQGETIKWAKRNFEKLLDSIEYGDNYIYKGEPPFIWGADEESNQVKVAFDKNSYWESYSLDKLQDAIKEIVENGITTIINNGNLINFDNSLIYLFSDVNGSISDILLFASFSEEIFYESLFVVILDSLVMNSEIKLEYDITAPYRTGNYELENIDWNDIEKTIILTEGKSDNYFLESAIRVLQPHVYHLYGFLDIESTKASGSANHLVTLLKSLIAANLKQRFIAIFDNDTAAWEARSSLNVIKDIPDNFVITNYPDLEFFDNYPTLGPTGLVHHNINRQACSIEMYSGSDVLMDENGKLMPIQWKGYSTKIEAYQGEIINKKLIQEKLKNKLEISSQECDWGPMNKLLQVILNAYN